jgi:hypothetical protein
MTNLGEGHQPDRHGEDTRIREWLTLNGAIEDDKKTWEIR